MIFGLRMTQVLDRNDAERAKRRNCMLRAVLKIFFVMGLTWIAEMISWALEAKFEGYNLFKFKEFVYCDLVFQIINSCHGIILFLVVFFDSKRITELKKKMTKKPVETIADPSSTLSPSTNVTNMRYIFPFYTLIEFLTLPRPIIFSDRNQANPSNCG